MANETEERYDISFAGECLDGKDSAAVRAAVGDLFKADKATLDRLFSGTRQRIKKGCDKTTALKYQRSLAAAGAKAIITRASDTATGDAGESSTAPKPPPSAVEDSNDLALLPGGSDILRPDERTTPQDAQVDLGHLSLAEAGARLADETHEPVSPVSAPDFDIAEPGARIGPEETTPPPVSPDTSAMDLAPAGADLSDGHESAEAPEELNVDHLILAESGSDLLKPSERKASDASAPDTSHLALDSLDEPPSN